MHMADALLSPSVGVAMWAAAGAALALASRRVRQQGDERLVPLMGMLGAFVFAAQMLNFGIPGTGSSGHLGGGLLLALLLGPWPALVVMASVLTVQALLFADGGLLALGANIFNMGVVPCLVAYPLIYRPLAGAQPSRARLAVAAAMTALVALQLGAIGVVLQTTSSGISALPVQAFAWLMLPIHAAIGVVEALATVAIVLFVQRHRPDLLRPRVGAAAGGARLRPAVLALGAAALALAGMGSWFASRAPDGLEWSVARASAGQEPAAPTRGLHAMLAQAQQATALLPDYQLPTSAPAAAEASGRAAQPWPAVSASTSLAGVLGGVATLALVVTVGLVLRRRRASSTQPD